MAQLVVCVYGLFLFFRFSRALETLRFHSAGLLVKEAARLGTLVGACPVKENPLDVRTQQIPSRPKSRFGTELESVD